MHLFGSKRNSTSSNADNALHGSGDPGAHLPGGPSPDVSGPTLHNASAPAEEGMPNPESTGTSVPDASQDHPKAPINTQPNPMPPKDEISTLETKGTDREGIATNSEHADKSTGDRDASSIPVEPEPKPILRPSPSPPAQTRDALSEPSSTADIARVASVNKSITSHGTGRSGYVDPHGSTFAGGAATTATAAPDVDSSVRERSATADEELEPKDRAKIAKEEQKHGRTLSKIIKGEARAEKAALEVAMKELAEIQKIQNDAVKEESQSHTRHSHALSETHKAEMELLAARSAHERGQTTLRAAEEALEASRKHARDMTELLREKMDEVERLRMVKQADDRERVVKVKGLAGEVTKEWFQQAVWLLIGSRFNNGFYARFLCSGSMQQDDMMQTYRFLWMILIVYISQSLHTYVRLNFTNIAFDF
ncbi:hypothetical protein EW146_g8758 [Bondarzewia mesenterica]|uniref:Uncharacterized protein n=1 Tax=Bondarzewia mesenterica TaxID=1095465 RepID=A0A4S4LC91_9AGAM|nr:hypothetical protein EW146_g8758 [Bondarzewia mesenterica]